MTLAASSSLSGADVAVLMRRAARRVRRPPDELDAGHARRRGHLPEQDRCVALSSSKRDELSLLRIALTPVLSNSLAPSSSSTASPPPSRSLSQASPSPRRSRRPSSRSSGACSASTRTCTTTTLRSCAPSASRVRPPPSPSLALARSRRSADAGLTPLSRTQLTSTRRSRTSSSSSTRCVGRSLLPLLRWVSLTPLALARSSSSSRRRSSRRSPSSTRASSAAEPPAALLPRLASPRLDTLLARSPFPSSLALPVVVFQPRSSSPLHCHLMLSRLAADRGHMESGAL